MCCSETGDGLSVNVALVLPIVPSHVPGNRLRISVTVFADVLSYLLLAMPVPTYRQSPTVMTVRPMSFAAFFHSGRTSWLA